MDGRKPDEVCSTEANDEVVKPSVTVEQAASLGPKTPVADRENGDICFDLDSPLAAVKPMPKATCFDSKTQILKYPAASVDPTSPRTPKDSVFDPFAPGPESMALAPLCKKYTDRLKISVARPLSFDSCMRGGTYGSNLDSPSDQEIFDSVYENLLEFIVSKQMEHILAEISEVDWDHDDTKSPPSAPRLSGIADTCPRAPVKPAGKPRIIDSGLCRKLF